MQVKSFQIRNFRSIQDSDVIHLKDGMTILVGENESGKTSILDALELFNYNSKRRNKKDIPKKTDSDDNTEHQETYIRVDFFNLDSLDICNLLGSTLNEDNPELSDFLKKGFSVDKTIHEGAYYYSLYTEETFDNVDSSLCSEPIYNYLRECFEKTDIKKPNLPDWNKDVIPQENFKLLSNKTKQHISGEQNPSLKESLEKVIKEIDYQRSKLPHSAKDLIIFNLFHLLDFEFDLMKFDLSKGVEKETQKEQVNYSSTWRCFAKTAGINIHRLKFLQSDELISTLHELEKRLNQHIKKILPEQKIAFKLGHDVGSFFIHINETTSDWSLFDTAQRSHGMNWILYFIISTFSYSQRAKNKVFLIDEPAQLLHAKAQKAIAHFLNEFSDQNQVLISTHSPYFIDFSKLEQVWLVEKKFDEGNQYPLGTKVTDTTYVVRDSTTIGLAPIISNVQNAMGYHPDLFFSYTNKLNIVTEGISDRRFLTVAMRNINPALLKKIAIVPSAGANFIKSLIPIMEGWGMHYCVLLDNDKKGREVHGDLCKVFAIDDKVEYIDNNAGEQTDACTEDLFSTECFHSMLNLVDEKIITTHFKKDYSNSKLLTELENSKNQPKYGKALASLKCLDATKKDFELDAETTENFEDLFERIEQRINTLDLSEQSED